MHILKDPTRILFFTGKGGVGKTSVACATAVGLADAGKRVLLVSTDPASNLDEVLGIRLGTKPTAVPKVPNLKAMNLDPAKSAAEYRERMVGPYRGLLPETAIASMEEQFSGSCTLEIAAFDEFSRWLGDANATAEYAHILFDTAPTGHTLRLLTLPSAWSGFMEHNTTGTSCLGPLAGLQAQQELYRSSVRALSDPAITTLVLVTRAEGSAFREADRTRHELAALGIQNQELVINGLFEATDRRDAYAVAMEKRGEEALKEMPEGLKSLKQWRIPLQSAGILGIEALRRLGTMESERATSDGIKAVAGEIETASVEDGSERMPGLESLIEGLVEGGHGVILAMGKGGVGKTTVAAAVAIAIAERGYDVHLTTTDPAAHLVSALNAEQVAHLTVSRIDPAVETARYAAEVLERAGRGLDVQGRALLEEDLRSPCTEEIAVFRAFAEAVAKGVNRFVVLDTAPTGHTILLLDSALAYHREVTRQASEMPESVSQLLPRLRDPRFTRVLIVTLPEATPVHEAAGLQRDLRRAEIEPYAWVVNQALSPLPVRDRKLKERQAHEQAYLREVREVHAHCMAVIAWQKEAVVGLRALRRLAQCEEMKIES